MSNNNPLGSQTQYPDKYDRGLLFPIERALARESLKINTPLPFRGEDRWTAFEVSWLNTKGKPQVCLAEFVFPCDSTYIVESKSFKLYLNSFNQTHFEDECQVKSTLSADLSATAGTEVSVVLTSLHCGGHNTLISEPTGTCLDTLDVNITHYQPDPDQLIVSTRQQCQEIVYSHLLKTNCPVTGQPDWATVFIEYTGPAIHHAGLLTYLVSFRDHQDYHENCVERLFCDIDHHCRPKNLTVYARYTRRGGLDINPLRSNYPAGASLLEIHALRMMRQ